MKKKLFLFMLAATTMMALSNCKDNKRSHADDLDDEDDVELTDADEEEDGDMEAGLPERADITFSTKVLCQEDDDPDFRNIADSIIVRADLGNGEMWVTGCSAEPLDTTAWRGFGDISEKDINFDGYPDLQVCRGPVNSYGNFTYAAWLWDNERREFVRVQGYEDLFDPELRSGDKTIYSSFRMDDHEDNAVYGWENGKLTMLSSETVVYSELEDE
jgi:hypothetical protein